jgi:xylulokinase
MALLAIDIGSSGPKATIYARTGEVLCSSCCEFPPRPPAPDIYEHELDPEKLWESLVAVLGQLPVSHRANVAAVSISSHGESFVPVDANGNPVGPFILNLDIRATQEAEEIETIVGRDELYRLTGLPSHAMYPLPKIAWLRRHRPAIFDNAAKFLCVEDYLLQRIGVGAYISDSLASRTYGFDLKAGKWSDWLLSIVGISPEKLATPVSSGTALGPANPKASASLGLPARASWVAGGHDQACCSLGGGGISQAIGVDGSGTFECLSISHQQAVVSSLAFTMNFPIERHVIPEMFLTLAYVPAGAVLSWLRDIAGERIFSHQPSYASLFSDLPAQPTGLFFFPHLVGTGTPWLDAKSRGALKGITYEMVWNIELLSQAGLEFERIHAVGGGARSDAWLQLKADIFAREIVAIEGEASCMGAAICAGVGIGAFSSWEDGAKALVHERKIFYPNPDHQRQYSELLASYKLFAKKLYGYCPAAKPREVPL